ncbi:MAG: hypothetical protein LBQ66_04700 [Planctomycetaceae bacterium]|nr:hypothetical protein [Planctomycetaceae bacterium]
MEMLQRSLHRRYKWQSILPERSVIEHLVYASLLENSPVEAADSAYAILEGYFIDWNEIRVTTVAELADTISMLPDPMASADRVRRGLKGVFDKIYLFDLEDLRKRGKGLSQAVAFLKSIGTLSNFVIDYVTQFALDGHVIPLDEAALRVFRLLDLAQVNKERTQEDVPGLERAIPKKNGISFTMELHNFSVAMYEIMNAKKDVTEYFNVLKNIDPKAPTRSFTAPALVVQKPPKETPAVIPVVKLPFVAADDDDFEEEHGGTEVEFLPNGEETGLPTGSFGKTDVTTKQTKSNKIPLKVVDRIKTDVNKNKITPQTTSQPNITQNKIISPKNQPQKNTQNTTEQRSIDQTKNHNQVKNTPPTKTIPPTKTTTKPTPTPTPQKSTPQPTHSAPIKSSKTDNKKIKTPEKKLDQKSKQQKVVPKTSAQPAKKITNNTTGKIRKQLRKVTPKQKPKSGVSVKKVSPNGNASVTKQLQKKRPK